MIFQPPTQSPNRGIEEPRNLKPQTAWRAEDLIRLYASFLREDGRRKERLPRVGPKSYGGGALPEVEEKYLRAFLRVVQHEQYRDYEPQLLTIYVERADDPMAAERCAEFVLALDASLDKDPFVSSRNREAVEEAEDAFDALIPVTTCAKALGISRATLHRWIDAGLIGVMHRGNCRAVQKLGSRYCVHFLSALAWKQSRGR